MLGSKNILSNIKIRHESHHYIYSHTFVSLSTTFVWVPPDKITKKESSLLMEMKTHIKQLDNIYL